MSEYWKKRFEMLEEASNQDAIKAYRQIEPSFISAQKQIEKEINVWVARVAVNNDVTMAEARKLLNAKELAEFKWDVNQYIEAGSKHGSDPVWMKKLENASAKFHISKLEALQVRTQQALETAFGNETDVVDSMIRKTFSNNYYKTIYEVQKGFGTGWEVGQIDQRKLDKVVSRPWSTDGKTFSSRIWDRKSQMIGELQNQLVQTCILGKTADDAVKTLEQFVDKKILNAENAARRLVMTEQAFFHSESQKEAFKELGVEKYEIVATLDSKTSDICQNMDGQVFEMKDFESGVTAPPFHVYCRSVVAPYFDDNFGEIGERAARDEVNDKTYYVPADMKYPDWKKAFVDGSTIKVQPVQKGGIIKHTKAFDDLLSVIKKDPCDYIEVEDLKTPLSEDEIIERLCGGDLTKGSCASLAYAYAGNKAGWDVLDFRGGNSQYHFSSGFTKDWILQFDNVKSIVSEDYNAIKNTYSVLNDIEKGKEYILGVGGHAAVIRKRDDGVVEYLELQSEKDKGWHSFTKDTLKNRFNAKRSRSIHGYKLMQKTTLIDVESLGKSDDFRSILGYLNTSASKQKKGVGGYAK